MGKNKEKCALGVRFPFEQLDIFIGTWCATMVPHISEDEFAPDEDEDVPQFARYLKKALAHPYYAGNLDKLLREIDDDFELRGLKEDRRTTYSRIRAMTLLLYNTGTKGLCIPASVWDTKRLGCNPGSVWSDEQQEVLNVVAKGVTVDDANVEAHSRLLFVSGKPGAGKTEAFIGCALAAAAKGERVLIACPIGALVDVYRQRSPPNENIVIETVHASHRITRNADETYNPPGRLRNFDLIIYEEISQLPSDVWHKVRTAIVELNPHPFVMLVGDFQQLQPAFGEPELKDTLEAMVEKGTLRHIELQQHPFARSNDPVLLDFLAKIREEQPSKDGIHEFFGSRRLAAGKNCRKSEDIGSAVAASMQIERATGKSFTFLTVTNKGAQTVNHARCLMEFGDHERIKNGNSYAVPGDPDFGGAVIAVPGMKIRLTRNVDKERGFVNGALAEVEQILAKGVFVVKTPSEVRILVHPITMDGKTFVPFCYGYAMTIRRSQGSTLEQVGLWFDHKYPADRGYAYVGASRVRRAIDLWLIGKVKRSDWLPVGEEKEQEQARRDHLSETTSSNSEFGSEDQGDSDDEGDEDQGATTSEEDEQDGEDQGATQSDEEDPGHSDDEDLGQSDDGDEAGEVEDDVDEDQNHEADPVALPKPAAGRARRADPAPKVAARTVYSEDALAVEREWLARERMSGPYRQLLLGEDAEGKK